MTWSDARLVISAASAVWTFSSSIAAVLIGLENDSLALVVFGAVAVFDCGSDVVLVAHFRAAQQGRDAEHLERVALRIVSVGLVAIGLASVGFSIRHLSDHQAADSSVAAIVLASASLVVLALLAYGKRVIGTRLPSRALHADGQLTGVGAVLAAVTLGGTAATGAFDWWWADPAAALLIGVGAITLGLLTAKDVR